MLKKIILGLLLVVPIPALAQTGAIEGFCDQGGRHATTSGLNASNFQQGDIPSCTITVYVANTQSLATLYSDRSGTPLSNPFTADVSGSVFPGHWIFWASTSQAYDVIGSGGISPNTYPAPVPLCTDCYPSSQFNVTGGVQTIEGVNSYNCTGPTCDISGEALALEHNSSATGILQTLLNLCDNGSCGPSLDTGFQQVVAKTGSSDGSWVLETASTAASIQQLPTNLPTTGQHIILYPQSGVTAGCGSGMTCTFATGQGAWMQQQRIHVGVGGGATVTLTGATLTGSGVSDSNVTSVWNCSTGYVLGYGAQKIPNTPLFSTQVAYGTYCTEVATGPGYNYASASWTSQTVCSVGCTTTSGYNFAQPFLVVYYSGTPVTNNFLSFAPPLLVQGQTVGLQNAWPAVFDTGTTNAYASAAPWVTNLVAGQEIILLAQNNNTGGSTLAFNGAPAAAIHKAGGVDVASGDITTNAPALLIYQSDGTWLDVNPQTGNTGGTVTSVGMTVPSWLSVAGSPITSSGTLAVTAATGQTANEVLASPNGSSGALTVRALVNADLPSSGVSAGSYTNSNITVNAQGIVTSASNGSGGSGLTVGSTTISGGTSGNGLYDNAGVLGEKAFAPALGNCTAETISFSAAAASCYYGNAASGITATLPSISTGAIMRIQNNNTGTVTASFGSNFNCTLNGTTTSTTTCAIANGSTGIVTTDGTSWYVAVTPTSASGGGGGGLCPAVNNQTGTSYTLVLTDGTTGGNACIGTLTVSNVASNTVTVPPNASVALPVPDEIDVIQLGSGQTCLVAGAGVTLNTPTSLCARATNSTFAIRQIATNTWQVSGDTQ